MADGQDRGGLTGWLERSGPWAFGAVAILASFTTYFCMYAIRKPFSAGTFAGTFDVPWLGALDHKPLLVLSQLLGYTLSKFLGIKVVSEMSSSQRAWTLLGLLGAALATLLGFAVTPAPWHAVWLFLNGVPLGMVWGLVFSFLEGRQTTEALAAGLSASYVLADGAVKSVGKWVMAQGASEGWMPFLSGALFVPPLLVAVWVLARLPPPSAEDVAARHVREPMDGPTRSRFFRTYFPGLAALMLLHLLLTSFRDFSSNFEADLWRELGYAEASELFTTTKIPVTLAVLLALGTLFVIRSNRRAMAAIYRVMLVGSALIGLATLARDAGALGPLGWMITVQLGIYLAYVPFGSALFERMIVALGEKGNAGFLIYLVDAFGYLGSVGVTLYKTFGAGIGAASATPYLDFYTQFALATSGLCVVCFGFALIFFDRPAARVEREAAQ
jgi:hypothetical protein